MKIELYCQFCFYKNLSKHGIINQFGVSKVMTLEAMLGWYQQKIGLYDKQSWESTVENRIIQGLSYAPLKTAKLKTDLIDVDLVRGSTFPKAKPQSDLWLASLHGIGRMIFLPLYIKWWIRETSLVGYIFAFSLYSSVMLSCILYYYSLSTSFMKTMPLTEVTLPVGLLILLSMVHSQMSCTRRSSFSVTLKNKRKMPMQRINVSNRIILNKGKRLLRGGVKSYRSSHSINLRNKAPPFASSYRSRSEESSKAGLFLHSRQSISEGDLSRLPQQETQPQQRNFSKDENSAPDSSLPRSALNASDQSPLDKTSSSAECILRYRNPFNDTDSEDDLPRYHRRNLGQSRGYRHPVGRLRTPLRVNRTPQPMGHCGTSSGTSSMKINFSDDCESPTSEGGFRTPCRVRRKLSPKKRARSGSHSKIPVIMVNSNGSNSSCDSEDEVEVVDVGDNMHHHWNPKVPLDNWLGSFGAKEPSCSSDSPCDDFDESDHSLLDVGGPLEWHIQGSPAAVIQSPAHISEKVSCKIWEGTELKKIHLSVLDISSLVIKKVESKISRSNYLTFGIVMAGMIAFVPSLYRLVTFSEAHSTNGGNATHAVGIYDVLLGDNVWCCALVLLNAVNRFLLGSCTFFLLSVAERVFEQRFLYAKHFCYLTSARRARKYDLLHFRLNKVVNIKSWLSIRSCLKKRGPQHSVEVIVSATFCACLVLVCYLCVELLKEEERSLFPLLNCELFIWCFVVSIYLIRFLTLGALINKKYSNPSILITEQINMYLHMERKPHKKEDLMLANNVLKLVTVLLKELETPFKISGLSANPLLYNVTKFVILSACSAVLSELFGFKLKLHRIKFK